MGGGSQGGLKGLQPRASYPAVTIAVAKKAGIKAVNIAKAVKERFTQLQGTFIPEGVKVTITRNYGETAETKVTKLITKLVFATLSVIALVLFAIGWCPCRRLCRWCRGCANTPSNTRI